MKPNRLVFAPGLFQSGLEIEAYLQKHVEDRKDYNLDQAFREWEQDRMPKDRWRILSQEIAQLGSYVTFKNYGESDILIFRIGPFSYITFATEQSFIQKKLLKLNLIKFDKLQGDMYQYLIKDIDLNLVIYKLLENGYTLHKNELIISCKVCSSPAIGKCCPSGSYCGKNCQKQDIEHVCK